MAARAEKRKKNKNLKKKINKNNNKKTLKLTFPRRPMIRFQNNFTEMFLEWPSTKMLLSFCSTEEDGHHSLN